MPHSLPIRAGMTVVQGNWFSRGRVTIALALIVNLIFASAYMWSREGQTTIVRIEARGDQFTASVDGNKPMTVRFPGTQAGGIDLRMNDDSGVTSLPNPSGIDSIVVRDAATGETLFEDDFDGPDYGEWRIGAGTLKRSDGLLQAVPSGRASLTGRDWRDVSIEIRYRNVTQGTLNLRSASDQEFVEYHFTQFQQSPQQFVHFTAGEDQLERGESVEASRVQLLKSMTAMALRPYPLLLIATLAAAALYVAVAVVAPWARGRLRMRAPAIPPWAALAAAWSIATALLFVTMYINTRYSARLPHWPDATAYVFQAKIFASGRLAAPEPAVVPPFDYFYPTLTPVSDGRWATVFPFGHPMLLAVGEFFGAMWMVPSFLAQAAAVLLFFIGRRMYGAGVALIAALLFATSPFVLMQSSNFMSHSSAVFYLLSAVALLLLPSRRIAVSAALAGVCFGLLFNTRPLSAAALAPAFGVLMFAPIVQRERGGLPRVGAFAAGALVMLAAYFLYNLATSGDLTNSNYRAINETLIGFGGNHSVSAGMQNDRVNLSYLLLVLHGWPQYVGLLFVLLPFALGSATARDWWCLLAALPVLAAYTLFGGNGVMQGPRLWYEAVPFLMLLAARGGVVLAETVSAGIDAVRVRVAAERWQLDGAAGRAAVLAAAYACVIALVSASVYGWLLGRHEGWRAQNVPATASDMRGFDRVDDRMQALLEAADLEDALVLVDPCLHWECYGSVFWMNNPTLSGNIVFARNLPEDNLALFNSYPDRRVYVANYERRYLAPYGVEVASGFTGVARSGTAPLASELAAASAVPSAR